MYVCVYVCVCICMCVHMYVCAYVCMCICMYVYMYVCVYVCIFVYVYMHICIYGYSQLQLRLESQYGCTYVRMYVRSIKSSRVFIGYFFDIAHLTLFLPGERHAPAFEKKLKHFGPFLGKKPFSKYGHVIYRRKAFLMLISDFEFILPDIDMWA